MSRWNRFIRFRGRLADVFIESGCVSPIGYAKYFSGSLSEYDRLQLESHLAGCETCLARLADHTRLVSQIPTEEESKDWAATSADIDHFMNLIRPQLEIQAAHSRRRPSLWSNIFTGFNRMGMVYAGVALLALSLVAFLMWNRFKERPDERLYAQGLENLKTVSPFEPTSGLRFIPIVKTQEWRGAASDSEGGLQPIDKALANFLQALGSRPQNPRTRIALGQIYLVKGQPAEAQSYFQGVLQKEPQNMQAGNGLGLALYELAMVEKDLHKKETLLEQAATTFTGILAGHPRQLEVLYNQVNALYKLGNKAKALAAIEQYLALDSSSAWSKKLSAIRDTLRLNSYRLFSDEIEQAYQSAQHDRLSEMVAISPHAIWVIKRSLLESLRWEVEGHFEKSRQALGLAETVESVYAQSTGNSQYHTLIEFYAQLTREEKQQKYFADRLGETARTHYGKGDWEACLKAIEQALPIYAALEDRWEAAFLYHLRGNSYFYLRSDFKRALKSYGAMQRLGQQTGDHDVLAYALGSISVVYQDQAQYYAMQSALDEMYHLAEEKQDNKHMVFALTYLGNLYRQLGDYDRGIEHYGRAVALCRATGDSLGEFQALEHIGYLYQRKRDYEKSIGFL